MGIIRRSPTSHRDYAAIWDYVAERNVAAADDLLREFDAKVRFLSDNRYAGPARPELRPRLRSYPVGSYMLFYRPMRGGIELVRVIHGAREVRRNFKRQPPRPGGDE